METNEYLKGLEAEVTEMLEKRYNKCIVLDGDFGKD